MTVRQSFRDQAQDCTALGSPFTGDMLEMLAQNLTTDTAVGARVLNWQGDASNRTDAVALRLAGALHALVLQRKCPALSAAYPPNKVGMETLWQAIQIAMRDHSTQILDWLKSPPQTNEVRRSAALMPAFLGLQDMFDLPLALSELGASAGLNLNWDKFHLNLNGVDFGDPDSTVKLAPEWHGPLPPNRKPAVIDKAGCDLNPLDPSHDALRLRAYIWPDQTDRLARTEAAITIACAQQVPIARMGAEVWLETRLKTRFPGAVHVIYHTIAWQYFPPKVQKSCEQMICAAGATATADAPIAWVSMEADGKDEGAGLRATVWPGGQSYDLGRADFHGRWVRWNEFTAT